MKKKIFIVLGVVVLVLLGAVLYQHIQADRTAVEHIEYKEEIYIGNKNSKKFHSTDCRTLPAEKNRVKFSSRDKAISRGYSPCKNCNP